MLGSFLKHGLTREEAEGETLVQIIAGSDTTATAIRTTMLYLMASPHSYAALAGEVRGAAAGGRISSPITDAEARELPYLQAVIKEGLRIHPPVAGLMSTVVPKGGDVIHGIAVPEGTEIGSSAFGVQYSKDVYGVDAEQFRPERWLEAKGQRLKDMTSTWELIFKYGKWQCLGRTVALIELNKVFVEVGSSTSTCICSSSCLSPPPRSLVCQSAPWPGRDCASVILTPDHNGSFCDVMTSPLWTRLDRGTRTARASSSNMTCGSR